MPNPASIVTLGDVKTYLNMGTPNATRDAKLQQIIDGSKDIIEDLAGRVVPATISENHNAGDISIYLRERPLLSVSTTLSAPALLGATTLTVAAAGALDVNMPLAIRDGAATETVTVTAVNNNTVSVTPTIYAHAAGVQVTNAAVVEYRGFVGYNLTLQPVGQAIDAFGYSIDDTGDIDRPAKLVRRSAGSTPIPFGTGGGMAPFVGAGKVQVTYIAGRVSVPNNVMLANLELLRHLWDMTQQGGRPGWNGEAGSGDTYMTPQGFAVPARVVEILGKRPIPTIA